MAGLLVGYYWFNFNEGFGMNDEAKTTNAETSAADDPVRKTEIVRDLEIMEKHTPPDLQERIKGMLALMDDESKSIFMESTIFALHVGRALGQHDMLRQQMMNRGAGGTKSSDLLMKMLSQSQFTFPNKH
jgi:hypothetical protein